MPEPSVNEQLAVLTALQNIVKERLNEVRAQADEDLLAAYDEDGVTKKALKVGGIKVGDYMVMLTKDEWAVTDAEAFNDFALMYGFATYERGIKPEYECFEMGHLDTILTMARKGQVPGAPMQFNFVLGVPGCTPATVANLCWLVNAIPAGSTWTVTGIGRHAFPMAAAAIAMGGNVRVGFEDNLNLAKGVPAKSNGELVAKVVRLAKELGREVATSDEAREILGLKPRK